MLVVVLESAPPRLRGRLSLWLAEIRSGVYVGDFSMKVADMIWEDVCSEMGDGSAVMVHDARNDVGYAFRTYGRNRRVPVDVDGLPLVSFHPEDLVEYSPIKDR